jgi:hypothetical protein
MQFFKIALFTAKRSKLVANFAAKIKIVLQARQRFPKHFLQQSTVS